MIRPLIVMAAILATVAGLAAVLTHGAIYPNDATDTGEPT